MRKTTVTANGNTRYLTCEAAKQYLSIGKNSLEKLAAAANARRKIGTRVVYDRVLIDEYLAKQMHDQEEE